MLCHKERRALPFGVTGLIALFLGGCADAKSSQPTPARWIGATAIDGAPTSADNCAYSSEDTALGADGLGGALALWQADCTIWATRYVPATGWATPEAIGRPADGDWPAWTADPALAVNGVGGAVAAWVVQPAAGDPHFVARRWDAASGWAAAERIDGPEARGLSAFSGTAEAALAMDRRGNALALWGTDAGVISAHFTAPRGWSAPIRLAGSGYPTVAFDASGRALASWVEAGVATLRWWNPDRGWEAPSRFPDGEWQSYWPSEIAFDGTGRAVVLWYRFIFESRYTTASAIWSATHDGTAWRELGRISPDGVRAGGEQLGADAKGGALGVWLEGPRPVFARFDFAAGWGAPQALDAWGRLAVAANGRAVLVRYRQDAQAGQGHMEASIWDGSTWGTVVPAVQDPGTTSSVPATMSVAVDSCGNAFVVWRQSGRIWADRLEVGCTPP